MRWSYSHKGAEQDAGTSELHHAEIVLDVPLPAGDDPRGVVEPGKERFDLPPVLGATERAAVLGAAAAATVRGDRFDDDGARRRPRARADCTLGG